MELFSVDLFRTMDIQKELAKVNAEIYDLETSRQSRSHAGPTLALRSLYRKRDMLELKLLVAQSAGLETK